MVASFNICSKQFLLFDSYLLKYCFNLLPFRMSYYHYTVRTYLLINLVLKLILIIKNILYTYKFFNFLLRFFFFYAYHVYSDGFYSCMTLIFEYIILCSKKQLDVGCFYFV